jgi:hypothetical protein
MELENLESRSTHGILGFGGVSGVDDFVPKTFLGRNAKLAPFFASKISLPNPLCNSCVKRS